MKKSKKLSILVLSALTATNFLALSPIAIAAEQAAEASPVEDTESLKQEIADLQKRLSAIETQQSLAEKNSSESKVAANSKKLKTHIEGQFVTSVNANSNSAYKLSGANKFSNIFRLHILGGDPGDKVTFFSEVAAYITPGEHEGNQGNYFYVNMANYTINKLWGFDSIKLGRYDGLDAVGIGGPLYAPGNYDGIELNKKTGAVNWKLWTGNYARVSVNDSNAQSDPNTLTSLEASWKPADKLTIKLTPWYNASGTHNNSNGSAFNALAGAGFDRQYGLDAAFDWSLGKNDYLLFEGTYDTLDNPVGGLKKHPAAYAVQWVHTNDKNRPHVFVRAHGLCSPDDVGASAWSIGYGSNDAGSVPEGVGNCMGDVIGTSSPYTIGDNENVLSLRYEHVITKGLSGQITLAHAWIKDKSLRSDLDRSALDGDNYIIGELTAFF